MKKAIYLLLSVWFCLGATILSQNPEWIIYNQVPSDKILCLEIDDFGNKWMGVRGEGLIELGSDNITWTIYDPFCIVRTLEIDDLGNKWFNCGGEPSNCFGKFDGSNCTYYCTPFSAFYIECIKTDKLGNKWIGDMMCGLIKLYADDSSWTNYNTKNSEIPSDFINCIEIDGLGNKWIGTDRGGLAKYDDTNWFVFDTSNSDLPYNCIRCISIDDLDNKWIAVDMWSEEQEIFIGGGLVKYDGNNWTVYNTSNSGLPSNKVLCIETDNLANIWIGTKNGLAKFDGTNWNVYTASNSGLHRNDISCIAIDKLGNKWIGTGYGLAVFNEGGVVPVPVELNSFTATANGKEVVLNWSTATELNNQGFEV